MRKRLLSAFLSITIMMSAVLTMPLTVSARETKVPSEYKAIKTLADLYAIGENLSGKYILMNDINASNLGVYGGDNGWAPLPKFSGTLDGNGYKIKGLKIKGLLGNSRYNGLFAKLSNATIKNLGMVDVSINVSGDDFYVGAIAGYADRSTITGCYVTGNITLKSTTSAGENGGYVGGLVGRSDSSEHSYCYNNANVVAGGVADNYAGGIVGLSYNSSYTQCYNTGKVYADYGYAGAIYGYSEYEDSLNYSYTLKDKALTDGVVTKALTIAQMKQETVWTGFDFEVAWYFDPYSGYDYPMLQSAPYKEVKSISVSQMPDETLYFLNEKFSTTGGKVAITYTDGTKKTVAMKASMVKVQSMKTVGKKTATITIGGKKTTFKYEVIKPFIESLTLGSVRSTLNVGSKVTLKVTVKPAGADEDDITWKTSNSKVATVSSSGTVTAKAAGTATITATAPSGVKVTKKFTVVKSSKPVTKLSFQKTKVTLSAGKKTTLEIDATPYNTTDKLMWSSSNTSVASVSSDGTVTAKNKAGTAKITVTSSSGKTATCTITVDVPLEIKSTSMTVSTGKTSAITIVSSPSDSVSFKSSNKAIATVDSAGNVKGVKAGKTTILVVCEGQQMIINVTVK